MERAIWESRGRNLFTYFQSGLRGMAEDKSALPRRSLIAERKRLFIQKAYIVRWLRKIVPT